MNINLELEEINFVLNVLGELPSKSGAWPTMMKIQAQAQAQTADPDEEPSEGEEPEEAAVFQ